MSDDQTAPLRVALADLVALCDRHDATADPEARFRLAGEVMERVKALPGVVAGIRARDVGDLWAAEELTLAALAGRLKVSKARADQLVRVSRETTHLEET